MVNASVSVSVIVVMVSNVGSVAVVTSVRIDELVASKDLQH